MMSDIRNELKQATFTSYEKHHGVIEIAQEGGSYTLCEVEMHGLVVGHKVVNPVIKLKAVSTLAFEAIYLAGMTFQQFRMLLGALDIQVRNWETFTDEPLPPGKSVKVTKVE